MFFDGFADKGRCAAGGAHVAQGSLTYILPYGYGETATAQIEWRYCRKCHGLFYNGFAGKGSVQKGRCAAGGDHAPERYNFALPHHVDLINGATTQKDWRFCRECHGLFYNGSAKNGRCPAGGDHVAFGWNFMLPHDLPPALDLEVPIVVPGQSLSGFAHLTLRQDGSYNFSGYYHDSGAAQYNINTAWVIKDSQNSVYTFEHTGTVYGTFEPGSRDDRWRDENRDDRLQKNWANLAAGYRSEFSAHSKIDSVNLVLNIIAAFGAVASVVGIVLGVASLSGPASSPK